jgi:hypothetical protein
MLLVMTTGEGSRLVSLQNKHADRRLCLYVQLFWRYVRPTKRNAETSPPADTQPDVGTQGACHGTHLLSTVNDTDICVSVYY